ncbi:hypothetical protein GQ600_11073 [Phytophthora cactorum]|nr:hypothetical protein GQ600_11073 [Phytophthora cactorum]
MKRVRLKLSATQVEKSRTAGFRCERGFMVGWQLWHPHHLRWRRLHKPPHEFCLNNPLTGIELNADGSAPYNIENLMQATYV